MHLRQQGFVQLRAVAVHRRRMARNSSVLIGVGECRPVGQVHRPPSRRDPVASTGFHANGLTSVERRPTLNQRSGLGREKDVAPKPTRPKSCPTITKAASEAAALQDIHEMARPGLEPGTPRFSVVCSTS